jgi:glucoamylase
VTITNNRSDLNYYLLVNSAMNNTGYGDSGKAHSDRLSFQEGKLKLHVSSSIGFHHTTMGYVGFTDGYQDLSSDYVLNGGLTNVTNGNIAGTGHLKVPPEVGTFTFYIIYHFGEPRQFAESKLRSHKKSYALEWQNYIDSLKRPAMSRADRRLYERSLYTLRVHADKKNKGALIASLSKPWGEETYEAPGVFVGGYHMVWPRDLYHVCAAFIQAGDTQVVTDALRFLRRIQYQDGEWNYGGRVIPRKGAFPQNTWTSAQEFYGALQIDQTAYPVHIFYQLYKLASDDQKKKLLSEFGSMIKDALDFIFNHGPWTAQERWEENYGISPSSFAAAASALKLGQKIFPNESYAKTANRWLTKPKDNIHTWTFTRNGKYGDGEYYIRIGGCSNHLANWNPDQGQYCMIANSGIYHKDSDILDQGFLKLSLQGLVKGSDPRLLKSLKLVNDNIMVKTPHGPAWYRYTYDAYGEEKKGRLWPLLSSEHGRFAIERYRAGNLAWSDVAKYVDRLLKSYRGFANDGLHLPEQVWEKTGEGTGAATPLAWSHAEYVKLLWSKHLKYNVENLLDN